MNDDLENYIKEKCETALISRVPGHMPAFKSKAEVDLFVDMLEKAFERYHGHEINDGVHSQ